MTKSGVIRLGSSEQQVTELCFAFRIKADNLAVEDTTAALKITAQVCAIAWFRQLTSGL